MHKMRRSVRKLSDDKKRELVKQRYSSNSIDLVAEQKIVCISYADICSTTNLKNHLPWLRDLIIASQKNKETELFASVFFVTCEPYLEFSDIRRFETGINNYTELDFKLIGPMVDFKINRGKLEKIISYKANCAEKNCQFIKGEVDSSTLKITPPLSVMLRMNNKYILDNMHKLDRKLKFLHKKYKNFNKTLLID
ncbi:hypothetical protein BpHYR1_017739 [Brachionus plicatilis]|uniref:Uncharacterized protein n=1 Tax=Brachionus plicatilis TaxID=10195 RepID=A0A3M7S6Y2_BRAPC|nr:hypothetical protein BpHYR1_017739 [Brachionus plicatilis]